MNKNLLIFLLVVFLGLLNFQKFFRNYFSLPQTRHIHVVGVEVNGTKFWIPSSITAKKGDLIKIDLINKMPAPSLVHGYKISDYNVEALVDEKGTSIEFIADKAGIFSIFCHLHPAHIGGQLIVLE